MVDNLAGRRSPNSVAQVGKVAGGLALVRLAPVRIAPVRIAPVEIGPVEIARIQSCSGSGLPLRKNMHYIAFFLSTILHVLWSDPRPVKPKLKTQARISS